MQPPDELDHPRIGLVVERVQPLVRDLHATAEEAALHVDWQVAEDRRIGRRALAVALAQKVEGGQRRVDDDLAIHQRTDERLDARPVEIERGRAGSRQVEPLQRAGVGAVVDEEVQHHLVDVLQFVVAGVDDVLRTHEGGPVPADAQPALVRVGHRVPQVLPREAVVDLDLRIAVGGVPVDRALRAFEVGHHEPVACRVGALALEEARRDDTRAEQSARRGLVDDLLDRGVVTAEVTHRRHACG